MYKGYIGFPALYYTGSQRAQRPLIEEDGSIYLHQYFSRLKAYSLNKRMGLFGCKIGGLGFRVRGLGLSR